MRKLFNLSSLLIALLLFCNACAPIRGLRWWQPDLNDSNKFSKGRIDASAIPFRFSAAQGQKQYQKLQHYLDTLLIGSNTNAFVVIKSDSIIYEYFADGVTQQTRHASFSVAKSFVGTLIGIAEDKGIIKSTDDLVIKYLPELEKNDVGFKKLTIQHVLDMQSGLDFDEDKETPFAGITKLYYGHSLNNQISRLKFKRAPGIKFEYQSINTQLLATILERVTGEKITSLLSKYLWHPLGAESDAIWSLDDQKTAKAFCCLNATAYDFAKLGRLYLNRGNWDGKQIVSKGWIAKTTNPDTLDKLGYKNQWWACYHYKYFKDSLTAQDYLNKISYKTPIKKTKYNGYYVKLKAVDYTAVGILGQYIYVNPETNTIIVRMGNNPKKRLSFENLTEQIGRQLK